MMAPRAYLALGSNLGDRLAHLRAAVALLRRGGLGDNWKFSALYETAPVGPGEQGNYYNAVAAFSTSRSPREVLKLALETELALGRRRTTRWAARNIDLDLLLHGEAVLDEPGLILPHPRLLERSFVLRPLCDLAPDLTVNGVRVRDQLAALGEDGLVRVAGPGWEVAP
ncbi:MAG: 2-amino-4-hydroxy-6-hydroxymethyldihydropteridine diphosphokinase [Opitutales bacterium]